MPHVPYVITTLRKSHRRFTSSVLVQFLTKVITMQFTTKRSHMTVAPTFITSKQRLTRLVSNVKSSLLPRLALLPGKNRSHHQLAPKTSLHLTPTHYLRQRTERPKTVDLNLSNWAPSRTPPKCPHLASPYSPSSGGITNPIHAPLIALP